ncbi:hypothetical protein EYF80_004659 [Liparis tanakae]|uniref:Uncharacterized protein n=1 Tax=Liparis tanakae TaxID=230148 RepID=A0A4Z2J3T7_9TELE|nr:hypothetical protein EYF80_004659 [Liparis tanakae]
MTLPGRRVSSSSWSASYSYSTTTSAPSIVWRSEKTQAHTSYLGLSVRGATGRDMVRRRKQNHTDGREPRSAELMGASSRRPDQSRGTFCNHADDGASATAPTHRHTLPEEPVRQLGAT